MAQESVLRIVIDSRNAERNARALASELDSIEKKGDFASKSMDSMSVATRQLAGYMAGVVTVGAAISKMDAYTGMQNRLKLVTDSQVELNTAMSDTFSIAQKSYQSWDSVIQVYQRFSDNAKTLRIDMAKTAELTETVSKAVAISGASTQAAEAALTQFGQALASGVLRGEELNSILEQTPALAKAIAQGMGITVGQLRSVAAEGKITGEVLVDALTKSKKSVDELFAKTDVTIGQSLQLLSNEVTKFTGEAGKASGVATTLASSIQILANNLDAIAGIAVVGGVALLTKTIAAQTVAIHGSITAVVARRAADTAALQSQVQLAAVEVQRTRQVAALAAQEIHLARQELNSATTRQARAAATMRLTQAEIAHSIALKQSASAVVAQTTAENALNASRSRSAILLGLVGGPIGALTIGVAALTAGYMYLKSRTAEANAKLEEQAAVAKKAKDELLALKGLEKDNAVNDMAAAFERQNAALSESSSKINMQLNAIEQLYKGNKEVVQVVQDARNGTISMTEAVQRFNELRISKEVYESIKANTVEFEKNAKEAVNTKSKLNLFGVEVELSGRKAQTAAVGVDENSKSLDKNATAAEKAAKAQAEFKKSLFDREFNAGLTKAMLDQGYNAEQINLISEYALKLQKEGKSITVEQVQYLLKINSIEEQNKKVIESRNAAEKERTKELEKQQKVLTASSKVQANAAKYNFSGLESKYGLPSGTLSAIHAIETGNTGKSNQVNSQTGATGGFQFLAGTAKQYGVKDRTDLAQSAEGAAKYMSYLLKLFKGDLEKAVRAYHAGEGNVQKGKNIGKYNNDYWQKFKGYTAGTNGFTAGDVGSKDWEKLLEEAAKMAEQQAELRKNLELNVADEVTRIRSKLADDLQEVDKAGYSPERAKELKAEYQTRADNDIAIAEYALKTKLDDYEAFKKTESQLLEDSFNERKFYAARDLELTKEQRDKAVALLDEQLKQEQALIKLAYETRLFQMREAFMSETAAMQERYRLEREQILLNSKLSQEQKQREIALSKALQEEENRKRLNNAVQQWGGIQAEMNGTGDQYRLEQERFSRYGASQDVFDAQIGQVEQAAQDPNANMEELAAQREAIWQEHHDRMMAIESDYYTNSQALQLAGMGQIASGLSSIVGDMAGEQSSAYKAMFAIEKGFAIAQSALAIQTGVSKAIALGFPQNIPVIAQTVMEGAKIASAIRAITDTGFANGGYTGHGGKYEPAGVVHKGEGVLTQEEVKALGGPQGFEDLRKSIRRGYATGGLVADTHRVGMGAVNAINSGGGNGGGSGGDINFTQTIVIQSDGSTKTDNQGDMKQFGRMIETAVVSVINRELRQGGAIKKAISRG
ncbi:tape measure protein [Acinetobacter johnsonii]|uniref:Tape measure protein n=1 Tax=Acinetobacter johnsonii TaxID=40214 RepID=A0AAW6RPB1_ACIJO|nr:tape measure protein [Acinetobacter johnsonii]MDG9785851.1 tape measure protein [Acinetobacter johnsonii]MDG9797890.1 tape measure protein [Acinetobacter johnsonii]